jgi:hypothetical protein
LDTLDKAGQGSARIVQFRTRFLQLTTEPEFRRGRLLVHLDSTRKQGSNGHLSRRDIKGENEARAAVSHKAREFPFSDWINAPTRHTMSASESAYLQAMEGQNALLQAIQATQDDLAKVSERLRVLQETAAAIQVASGTYADKQAQIAKQVARIQINLRFVQEDLKALQALRSEDSLNAESKKIDKAVSSLQVAADTIKEVAKT